MVKGILFNQEMVKAILEDRKSCTRILLKLPKYIEKQDDGKYTLFADGTVYENQHLEEIVSYIKQPYQVGDILYVREMQSIHRVNNMGNKSVRVHFKVDDSVIDFKVSDAEWKRLAKYDYTDEKFISPYWTTKETCRIFLKVTDVRVERLQDIADIQAEGTEYFDCEKCSYYKWCINNGHGETDCFANLWDSTVKEEWQKFSSNPYVWVIEFERCEKPEATT